MEKVFTNASAINDLVQSFLERALLNDSHDKLPDENFDDLIRHRLHTLTLDSKYGGNTYSFWDTSELLIRISAACPSTGLCMAMHYYTLAGLRDQNNETLDKIFYDIWGNGHFIASFNQPNIISVQRSQTSEDCTSIVIEKAEGGYIVNGVKKTVSGAMRFKYLPIYGYHKGNMGSRFGITALILNTNDCGIEITPTWKMSGMRSTGSHDIQLNNVFVPEDRRIGREGYGIEDTPSLIYWSRLAISSVYLGIAKAALDYITVKMKQKQDFISKRSIAFLPGNQFRYANMKIKYETSYNQIYMFARQAEEEQSKGRFSDDLFQKAAVTKYYVSSCANEIVWMAMEIEGSNSLMESSILEKLYRDVRASTFHQPSEDLLKEMLAKKSLGIIMPSKRWV